MKNKNLKICMAIFLSLSIHFLKAQSVQQQKADIEQRRSRIQAIILKAKEQQAQQQAEKRNEPNIPQQSATSNSSQPNIPQQPAASSSQPNIQPTTVQQNTSETRSATIKPIIKKPATVQQPALNGHDKKEELDQ
jgi:hypothetical protein